MCRTIQVNTVQSILVAGEDPLQPITFRVENVSIESEAMGVKEPTAKIQSSAESEYWKLLVRIVEFEDTTNGTEGFVVFVAVQIEVVQGLWICGLPVTKSKVYRDGQVELTAPKNVLQKAISLLKKELSKRKFGPLLLNNSEDRVFVSFQLVYSEKRASRILVFPILRRLKEFNLGFLVAVSSTQVLNEQGELIEFKHRHLFIPWGSRFNFRFVNWLPYVVAMPWDVSSTVHSIDDEE
jgi:hypothetical protein